jgi:hypothetical protein
VEEEGNTETFLAHYSATFNHTITHAFPLGIPLLFCWIPLALFFNAKNGTEDVNIFF